MCAITLVTACLGSCIGQCFGYGASKVCFCSVRSSVLSRLCNALIFLPVICLPLILVQFKKVLDSDKIVSVELESKGFSKNLQIFLPYMAGAAIVYGAMAIGAIKIREDEFRLKIQNGFIGFKALFAILIGILLMFEKGRYPEAFFKTILFLALYSQPFLTFPLTENIISFGSLATERLSDMVEEEKSCSRFLQYATVIGLYLFSLILLILALILGTKNYDVRFSFGILFILSNIFSIILSVNEKVQEVRNSGLVQHAFINLFSAALLFISLVYLKIDEHSQKYRNALLVTIAVYGIVVMLQAILNFNGKEEDTEEYEKFGDEEDENICCRYNRDDSSTNDYEVSCFNLKLVSFVFFTILFLYLLLTPETNFENNTMVLSKKQWSIVFGTCSILVNINFSLYLAMPLFCPDRDFD